MTVTYTSPTLPTFHSFSIPTKYMTAAPNLPSLSLTTSDLSANSVNARLLAWSYERYGTTIQSIIDGHLQDYCAYAGNSDDFELRMASLKEDLQRETQIAVEAVFERYSVAGHLPGYLPGRALKEATDIQIGALEKLSREAFRIWQETQLNVSQQHLEFALESGIAKEGRLFEHHNKVQMLNLEAVQEIARNVHNAFIESAKAHNIGLSKFDQNLRNHRERQNAFLLQWDSHNTQLQAIAESERNRTRIAELWTAGKKLTELANNVKLLEIDIAQTNAEISKANLLVYHANLEQMIANIKVSFAQYQYHRTQTKEVLADLQEYLKTLELKKSEIESAGMLIDEDNAKLKRDVAVARTALKLFETEIERFKASVALALEAGEIKDAIYATSLIQHFTDLRDEVSDLLDEHEQDLEAIRETVDYDLKMAQNDHNYNVGLYDAYIPLVRAQANAIFQYAIKKASAELAAQTRLASSLIHQIVDDT